MTVLLVRARGNEADAEALATLGIASVIDPYLTLTSTNNVAGADRMLEALVTGANTWLVITSPNVLEFFDNTLAPGELDRVISETSTLKFAAIGEETERQLLSRGARAVYRPFVATSEALSIELTALSPEKLIVPSGTLAMREFTRVLRDSGALVVSEVLYSTETIDSIPKSVAFIDRGEISAVFLRSPSAVRAFVHFNGTPDLAVVCGGPTTAAEAIRCGLNVSATAPGPSAPEIAQSIARVFSEGAQ